MEVHEETALKHTRHNSQTAELPHPKRPRLTMDGDGIHQQQRSPSAEKISRESYTVGWICALPLELAAARAMLDYEHADLEADSIDSNTYTLGTIGRHNVVIACLPSGHYGTNNAAAVAHSMTHAFRSLRFRLMVGIGGGIPGDADLRLGDVVVGRTVTQYDFGKASPGNEFKCMGYPVRPHPALMTAVAKLQAKHEAGTSQISVILEKMTKVPVSMRNYNWPKELQDNLFCSSYGHVQGTDDCRLCELSHIVNRPPRNDNQPVIHFEDIASGNQVIKDALTRDRIAQMLHDKYNLKVRSFEMEAAGMVDHFPCLVIRGICDYSDSHKNKGWQKYAAATAAAYAKEFINVLPVNEGEKVPIPCASNTKISPVISLAERLEQLKFPEIGSRHDNIRAAYTMTCQWLLNHPHYVCWLDADKFEDHNGFLWIKGKPGAGKSTLMKFVYTDTVKNHAAEHTAIISFFFNARGTELEKSTEGMYRSLTVQLLQRFPDLQHVLEASKYNHCATNQADGWKLDHFQNIFSNAIMKLKKRHLICFIDALDECDEDQIREMVEYFESLEQDATQKGVKVCICFSSRHYPHITIQAGIELTLEAEIGHTQDLEKFVLGRTRTWKGSLAKDLRAEILQKAAGIFMWVVLVVPILNKEFGNGHLFDVRDRLREIPSKLSDLFRNILGRDKDKLKDLLLCLRWILFAKRPLRDDEFYFAMVSGLTSDSKELKEWDPDTIPRETFPQFVLSSSKGLAEVTRSRDRSVQFIHESVRDFLIKDGGLDDFLPGMANDFEGSSHEELKQCCHKYYMNNAHDVKETYKDPPKAGSQDGKIMRDDISRRFPFFEYATQFLLYHADAACTSHHSQTDFIRNLDLGTWIFLDNILQKFETRKQKADSSLIYILAALGYANLIAGFTHLTPWFNIPGGRHGYPILAAISNGHREAVKTLICHGKPTTLADDILVCFEYGKSTTVNTYRKYATTLLHWACQKGYVPFVKLLILSGEFNPNDQDYDRFTALQVSAIHGQILTLKYLRSIGIIMQSSRLLGMAFAGDDEDLLAFAVDSNADAINMREEGLTSLDWAIDRGSISLVEFCLRKGADTSLQDFDGLTPLHRAARNRSADIAKALLQNKADALITDKNGYTPLHWAVKNGHNDVAQTLLENSDDAASVPDKEGYTPLYWAAKNELNDIVKILRNKGVDESLPIKGHIELCSATHNTGATSLHWAVRNGSFEKTKKLLERGADASAPDNTGATPLYWAVWNGFVKITKMLLERGADALAVDHTGAIPLHWAVWHGFVEITKMLLERGVGISNQNNAGNTPLHWAVYHGSVKITKMLLERGVDVSNQNNAGNAPLHWAAAKGFIDITTMLLERGVDASIPGKDGNTPLHLASLHGNVTTVEILLDNGADIAATNDLNETSLHLALQNGHRDIATLLRRKVQMLKLQTHGGRQH